MGGSRPLFSVCDAATWWPSESMLIGSQEESLVGCWGRRIPGSGACRCEVAVDVVLSPFVPVLLFVLPRDHARLRSTTASRPRCTTAWIATRRRISTTSEDFYFFFARAALLVLVCPPRQHKGGTCSGESCVIRLSGKTQDGHL